MSTRNLLVLQTIFVFFQTSEAYSQAVTQQNPPAASPWVPLYAALIGAVVAIVGILLKEIFVHRANTRLAKADTQRDIIRNYMAPLAASCEKLIWRFKEIFVDGRHQWLLLSNTLPVYNEYKRVSTLYRIATLLGWIRAINLELSALPQGIAHFTTPLAKAINKVQSALADGPHTELYRLEQLCASWNLDIGDRSVSDKQALAVALEIEYYSVAGGKPKEDATFLLEFSEAKKLECCSALARFLCAKLNLRPLSDEFIKERIQSAIESLVYQESLIYREWQEAIGDAMLSPEENSVRRFKIIGYAAFVSLLKTKSSWFSAFRTSINNINFAVIDRRDVRRLQLKKLAGAVAEMLDAIAKTGDKDLVNPDALAIAKTIQSSAPKVVA